MCQSVQLIGCRQNGNIGQANWLMPHCFRAEVYGTHAQCSVRVSFGMVWVLKHCILVVCTMNVAYFHAEIWLSLNTIYLSPRGLMVVRSICWRWFMAVERENNSVLMMLLYESVFISYLHRSCSYNLIQWWCHSWGAFQYLNLSCLMPFFVYSKFRVTIRDWIFNIRNLKKDEHVQSNQLACLKCISG